MNRSNLPLRIATAALAIILIGCATPPPPRTYAPASRPQPSGTVSVRYVPSSSTPAADASAGVERTRQQAHMRRALAYLQTARANLEESTSTRSGHRQSAIAFTNQAIGHVETGIANANSR